MISVQQMLMTASAAVLLVLGSIHLLYTFRGEKLHPRDPELTARMRDVSPRLTRETTMWKAWIGFNASHSCGAMLFGLVYGYLAIAQPGVLFGSLFLTGLGLVFLAGYFFLARAFWFKIPFRGVVLSAALYFAALVV